MPLSPKQACFIREYVVDLNGAAAVRAGYSHATAKEQASRLLTNVNIKEAVAAAMHDRAERTEITADRVLREYAKIAFADNRIRDVVIVH